ncbi:hypothetical protein V9T40_005325 [Parthenolecanium corni]|uniref:Uncharacterized protein n=1 Tax=Parthenolecanium corni TaxID=536013 RepID=A0AAN9Y2Y7_9HEMI
MHGKCCFSLNNIPPDLIEYNYCDENEVVDDPVLTFALSSDDELLASGGELLKSWKGQRSKGPLMKLAFNETGTCVASRSIDSTIRIWDIENHSCNFKLVGFNTLAVVRDLKTKAEVFSDQTILIYKVDSNFTSLKQMIGYLDETSTFFGEEDEYLVVVSNSSHLNVYDRNINCNLLKGHSDCIISVATFPGFPNILVSGSKDHSVRVWMCKDGFFKCVASVTHHQASVDAVVLSHNSQDGKIINAMGKIKVLRTAIARDQAINGICLSMRDDLIATGSDMNYVV